MPGLAYIYIYHTHYIYMVSFWSAGRTCHFSPSSLPTSVPWIEALEAMACTCTLAPTPAVAFDRLPERMLREAQSS